MATLQARRRWKHAFKSSILEFYTQPNYQLQMENRYFRAFIVSKIIGIPCIFVRKLLEDVLYKTRDAQILTMGNPQPGWAATLLSTAKELPVTMDQFHSFLTDFNAQFMTLILPRQKKTCAIGNKRSNTAKKLWGPSGWWQRESSGWQLCPMWATNPA